MCSRHLTFCLVVVLGLLGVGAGAGAQATPTPEPPAEAVPAEAEPAVTPPAEVEGEVPPAAEAAPAEPEAHEPAPPSTPEAAPAASSTPFAQDPAVESADLDLRLAVLDTYLADMQPRSRSYFGAWISMMSILAGGQAVQAVFEDDAATRAGLIVGASFSTVGLVLVLIAPTPGRYGHKRFSAMPQGTLDEKRRKALQGEEYLRGEAAAVRRTHSWFTHTLGATLGVGGFLGLYFGYDDNLAGALRTGLGTIAVTELRIWTRPKRAIRYLDAYRNEPTKMPTAESLAFAPMWAPGVQGIVMAGRF